MVFCCSALALFFCSCGRDVPPEIGHMTPAKGHGRAQTFRFEASYPGGAEEILDMQVFFSTSLLSNAACLVEIANGVNAITLRTNDGKGNFVPGTTIQVGAAGTVANDKCSVAVNQAKVERNGDQVVVTIPVVFTEALKGDLKVWVIASGPTKHSGWQDRGTWTVE
jgi:hypothetical protein